MRSCSLLFFLLSFFSVSLTAQIRFTDPSFENTSPSPPRIVYDWPVCNNTPDSEPGQFAYKPASDGIRYMGFWDGKDTVYPGITPRLGEGVMQEVRYDSLSCVVSAGKTYSFTIDIKAETGTYQGGALAFVGGNTLCTPSKLLWRSDTALPAANENWQKYTITFTPDRDYRFLGFYAINRTGRQDIQIDNISEIKKVRQGNLVVNNGGCLGGATYTPIGGSGPFRYNWFKDPETTPFISNSTGTAGNLKPGTYRVEVTDLGEACPIPDIKTFTITSSGKTAITGNATASKAVICIGETVQLDFTSTFPRPVTYRWSNAAVSNTAIKNPTATPTTASEYQLLVTDPSDSTCNFRDTVSVLVNPRANAGTDSAFSICPGTDTLRLFELLRGNPDTGGNWSDPDGSSAFSGSGHQLNLLVAKLTAGSLYRFVYTAKGAAPCPDVQATLTVTVYPAITSIAASIEDEHCLRADGRLTFSPTGGIAPYTYRLGGNPNQSANTFAGLSGGTYLLRISDAKGCTKDSSYTLVNIPGVQRVTFSTVSSACTANTGGFTVTGQTGGTAPFEYLGDGGTYQSSATFSGLGAGSHTLRVKDKNGCTYDTIVNIPAASGPVSAAASVTAATCDEADGEITIGTVNGGKAPYTFSTGSGTPGTGNSFTGLTAGTYTITVIDDNGCKLAQTVTVERKTGVSGFSLQLSPETCHRTDGKILVRHITGGNGPYTFSRGGSFGADSNFTQLTASTYTITVKDRNGCTKDSTVKIIHVDGPQVALGNRQNVSCFGAKNGSATVIASGTTAPYQYRWTGNPSQNASASGLDTGTYTCTVSDTNGCTATASTVITQPSPITLNVSSTPAACAFPSGTATASASGGTGQLLYHWNTTPPQQSAIATGLAGGSPYRITITDENGCIKDSSITISLLDGPQITLKGFSPVSCIDSANGSISVSIRGGTAPYVLKWNTTPVQTDSIAINLKPGDYTLTATDASGCTAGFTYRLQQPDSIRATFTIVDDPCGQSKGSITAAVSGGHGTPGYTWSTTPQQHSSSITGLSSATYQLTITDGYGCTANFQTVVGTINPPQISQVNVTHIQCEGDRSGSATVSATGSTPLTYSWNTSPVQTSATASGLGKGSYSCRVSDNFGCFTDTLVNVTELNPLPVFSLGPDSAYCAGDSLKIGTTQSADNYMWQNGKTTREIFARQQEDYQLTLTRNGCSYTDTIFIREDAVPVLNLGPDSTFCGNFTIAQNITVSGAAAYLWNDGSTFPQKTISNAGQFYAVISRGTCTVRDTVTYNRQQPITAVLPADVSLCTGDTLLVTAATDAGNPSFYWSSGETGRQITVRLPGRYSVLVSDAACSASDTIDVSYNATPVIDLGPDTTICAGKSIVLNSGNSSYLNNWNTGATLATITVTSAGIYAVTVSNVNCVSSDSIRIGIQAIPAFTLGNDTIVCKGEQFTIGAQLPGATYAWNSGQNIPFIEASARKTYQLTVTQNFCSSSDEIVVGWYDLPVISLNDTVLCAFDTIVLDARCNDCTYLWENGDTTANQIITKTGMKTVAVTSIHGCESFKTITISENTEDACIPQVYVPNTFTPDNDGINDLFLPVFRAGIVNEYRFEIYNRWGERIFVSKLPAAGWDGEYLKSQVPAGTYIWQLRYTLIDDKEVTQLAGKVNLQR
ncbi:MAG: gliding motility-associated C-terminal domain-containing protein [Bacteroidota bacterium]